MESLFLPLLIIPVIFACLYKFNRPLFLKARKVGIILLGIALLIGGIALFVISMDAANDVTVTAAESNNLAIGAAALAFGGLIILVAYFLIQSRNRKHIQKGGCNGGCLPRYHAPANNNGFCSKCGKRNTPEDVFCISCGNSFR